jgi:hypothetical protein
MVIGILEDSSPGGRHGAVGVGEVALEKTGCTVLHGRWAEGVCAGRLPEVASCELHKTGVLGKVGVIIDGDKPEFMLAGKLPGAVYIPLFEAKLLELPPSLGHNKLAPGFPKRIPAAAAQIRQVPLCVSHPIEYLLREDLFAKLGNLRFDFVQDIAGKED